MAYQPTTGLFSNYFQTQLKNRTVSLSNIKVTIVTRHILTIITMKTIKCLITTLSDFYLRGVFYF